MLLSGCAGIDGMPHVSFEAEWPAKSDVADATSIADEPVSTEAGSEPSDEVEAETTKLDEDVAWLNSAGWIPSSSFDIASHAFSAGMRGPTAEFAWEFRPVGRPSEIDWEQLETFSQGDGLAESNALLLVARHDRSPHRIDRVKQLAVNGFQLSELSLDKVPKTTALFPLRDRLKNRATRKNTGSDRIQAAAIEIWGLLLSESNAATEGWQELAALLPDAKTNYVRDEIIRSLGHGVAPTRLREVAELLASDEFVTRQPNSYRQAVVDGCLRLAIERPGERPTIDVDQLVGLQFDRDPRVRRAVGRLLAVVGDSNAFSVLQKQTTDVAPAVRNAAYESLGLLGTNEAAALLDDARAHSSDQVRAAVVVGFAVCRPGRTLGLSDEAPVVRQAAARALTDRPTAANSEVAKKLVHDPDRQVQTAMLGAIADWPDKLAIPVLTKALTKGSSITRRAALPALRHRTGIDDAFVVEASEPERDATIREWFAKYHLPSRATTESPKRPIESQANDKEIAWALRELDIDRYHAGAWETLRRLDSDDFPLLERQLHERRQRLEPIDWPELWNAVLPSLREDFVALRKLSSRDANERVTGAIDLAEFAKSQTPSPLVIAELSRVLTHEQNARVWRNVIAAISHDASSEADDLIPLALNSQWPDVRLLACEYVEREQRPEHGRWLAPLLEDSDAAVRTAAIRAAGACGHPALVDGTNGGLRAKLSEPSRDVRLEAATAMARLGDVSGLQELLHLAKSNDVQTRRKAASGLKLAGNKQAVDPIVSLAWTERDPKTRETYFDLLEEFSPPSERLPDGLSDEQKLELWTARRMQGGLNWE